MMTCFRNITSFKKVKDSTKRKSGSYFTIIKKSIVSNIKQYEDNDVELPVNLKSQMAYSGLRRQSLEELAENCTLYKIILSSTKDTFPYVNIMDDKQRLENNYSASFDMAEPRELAIKHLTAICLHAKKITLYDKYISSKDRNIDLIKRILPQKNLEITYNDIDDEHIELMTQHCSQWIFIKNPQMANRHDRYLIVDEKLEIILTSGFDHLNDTSRDFTYIIRNIEKSRF